MKTRKEIILDSNTPNAKVPVHGGHFTGVTVHSITADSVPSPEMAYISFSAYDMDLFKGNNSFNVRASWSASLPKGMGHGVLDMDMLGLLNGDAARQGKRPEFNMLAIYPPYDFLATGNTYKVVLDLEIVGTYGPREAAHLF